MDKCTVSPFYRQLYATIASVLYALANGASIGFSAILLPQLKDTENFDNISRETQSWIASLVPLAVLVGTPFAGLIAGRYGRKKAHLVLSIPMAVGWLLIAVSSEPYGMLTGRFCAGFAMGLHAPVSSIYIGELSTPKYRGFLLAWIAMASTGGIGLSHLLGTFLNWRTAAYIFAAFPFLGALLFIPLPDTPSWLISKKRFDEAKSAFKWYRGPSLKKLVEIQPMIDKKISETTTSEQDGEQTILERIKALYSSIRQPEFYKPLLILTLFFFMLQFSGAMALAFYAVQIFGEVLNGEISGYTVMVSLDGVKFVASIIACIALKHFRRRTATLLSGLSASVAMALFVTWIYCKTRYDIPQNLNWIPLTMLAVYVVALTLGVVSLPWSLLGELFPINTRNLGASLCSLISSLFLFTSSKTAPYLFASLSMTGSLLFYAGVTFTITLILMSFLPETKGKTLYEIEEGFRGITPDDISEF